MTDCPIYDRLEFERQVLATIAALPECEPWEYPA
jgi:hypothetical protein